MKKAVFFRKQTTEKTGLALGWSTGFSTKKIGESTKIHHKDIWKYHPETSASSGNFREIFEMLDPLPF